MTSYKPTPSDHCRSLQSKDHLLVTDFSEHTHLPTGLTKLCSYVSDRKDQRAPSGVLLLLTGHAPCLQTLTLRTPAPGQFPGGTQNPALSGLTVVLANTMAEGTKR